VIFDNFSAPETVFVTACAGASTPIVWLPEIADGYLGRDVVNSADSGAGVVTEKLFFTGAANRSRACYPTWASP